MLWLIFALCSAIFMSLFEIFQKKALFKEHSLEFGLERNIFGFILLIPLVLFISLDISFFSLVLVFVVSLFFVIADLYRSKAYKHMKISSAAPFYNLIPAVVAVLSFFFLGEVLELKQIVGIGVIIIGAYVLEVDHNIHTLLTPIKNIIKSKYIHFIFFVLILLSVVALSEKHIIDVHLEPLQFLFFFSLFAMLNYLAVTFFENGIKGVKNTFKKAKKDSFFAALFWNLEILFYFVALTMQMVSLVTPIKRVHTLFTTIGGGTIFKDKGLYMKIVACIVMFVGVLLIVV